MINRTRSSSLSFLAVTLILMNLGVAPVAANMDQVHFQGHVVAATNTLNGLVDIEIGVFTNATGGTAVWTQSVGTVSITDGAYGFAFGNSALVDVLTNDACWLEVEIDGVTEPDRRRMLSLPYALHARYTAALENPVSDMPAGMVVMWAGELDNIPEGWALCDGQNGTPDLTDRYIIGASTNLAPGQTGGSNSFVLSVSQLPSHSHSAASGSAGTHTHTAASGSAGNHSHSASSGSAGNHSHRIYQRAGYGSSRDRVGGHNDDQYGAPDNYSTRNNPGNHTHSVSVNSGGAHTHSVSVNSAGAHSHTITVNNSGGNSSIDNRPETVLIAFIIKL